MDITPSLFLYPRLVLAFTYRSPLYVRAYREPKTECHNMTVLSLSLDPKNIEFSPFYIVGRCAVEFGCLKVVNQMSYLTVGSLENTSRLVDVSLNWTINSTG